MGDGLNGIGVYETGEVEPEDLGLKKGADQVVMIGHPFSIILDCVLCYITVIT